MMEEGKCVAVVDLEVAVESGSVIDSPLSANAASRDFLLK